MRSIDLSHLWLAYLSLQVLLLVFTPSSNCHPNDPSGDRLDHTHRTDSPELTPLFTFTRRRLKHHQEFDVNWLNGTKAYNVNSDRGEYLDYFGLKITSTFGKTVSVTIDDRTTTCGAAQTYTTSDQTQFQIDPMFWYPDTWAIAKSPKDKQTYFWIRKRASLSGGIVNESGHIVAHFHASANQYHSINKDLHFTISSNGVIPNDVLVALYNTAILRMDDCGL